MKMPDFWRVVKAYLQAVDDFGMYVHKHREQILAMLEAADALADAIEQDHGPRDYEPECPECVALKQYRAAKGGAE